jgi:hypothetical protein
MQLEASMTYLPSPAEIAPTGQASAQAPQLRQESEIAYAMIKTLLLWYYLNFNIVLKNCNAFFKTSDIWSKRAGDFYTIFIRKIPVPCENRRRFAARDFLRKRCP